jgi:hypothetical protein
MKCGLVELYVDIAGERASIAASAVENRILQDRNGRGHAVRGALNCAVRRNCDIVVFPGWTLVEKDLPEWLVQGSRGRILVFECLSPDVPRGRGKGEIACRPDGRADESVVVNPYLRAYVVRDGRTVVGPVQQHIIFATDLWNGRHLSQRGTALVRALQASGPSGRRWNIEGVGEAMLILCGEANFVGGGGPGGPCRNHQAVEASGLTTQNLRGVRVFVHLGHTRVSLPALTHKRVWLSQSGLMLHTANIHSDGWWKEGKGNATPGNASDTAARAWVNGKEQKLRPETCDTQQGGHHRYVLKTLQWPP